MRFYGGPSAFFGFANSSSFYAGSAVSSLIPDVFPVSIGGRPYEIDLSQPFYRQYRRQIAPLIRTQADTQKLPGEHSLDPNGLWRRSMEDWSAGAGQRYFDRDSSVDNGFYTSKGIDCLTNKWQISLLPDTTQQRASANTNLRILTANGYVYICDGQSLLFTNSLSGTVTWTAVTGTPAVTCSSITTDGNTIYAAYGASGIYTTTAGGASASQYVSTAIGSSAVLGYVNGRLMLGNNGGDGKLYNITASGASLGTALYAPVGPSTVTWVGFAEGNNNLYAAANVGGKGRIYGTATTADGTTLSAPTVQGSLPNGETVASLHGYLGQIIVGTSLGVRYATASTSGGISLGSLIPTTAGGVTYTPGAATTAVQCAQGYGRWVWYGWTNYDGTSTGLGRLDLENFVISGVLPASASDLMATTQGAVTGVVNLNGTVAFCVSGQGVYVQSTNLVASGTLQSGYILYDLADPKIAALIDIETPGAMKFGSYSVALSTDTTSYVTIGTHAVGQPENPVTYTTTGQNGERFEIQLTLNRDATTTTAGPTISRCTLRAYPAPRRPINWQLPLVFNEKVIDNSMNTEGFDPFVELQALEEMAAAGEPVAYQEADQSYQVFVQDVQFLPDELTTDKHYFNGLCLVTLESIPVPN